MAIETLLTTDLVMNLSILLCVQASLGRLHFPSLARTLLVMCANTLLGRLLFPGFWGGFLPQAAICLLCGGLLAREKRPGKMLAASAAILCATCAAAGFASAGGLFPSAFAGLAGFACLLRRQRNPLSAWDIEITVEKNGVRERIAALIDTGNQLTEHRSALPVLIVEADAVPRLAELAEGFDAEDVRLLGYGVLGSGGEMPCFYPDKILIHMDFGDIPGPDCWVGLFQGRIPGRTRALAPAEFAENISKRRPMPPAASKRLRRISYVIFNRQTIHLRPGGADPAGFGLLHRRHRPASAAADPGGGNQPHSQGACRRYSGPVHHD